MSQLARRENAPHRAAFVTSLSRWYIRRLLGNLPPFHPCLSAERRPRIAPCGTSPPYGHTPRKSRHGKPFLSSYQCIRNWSRSSGGTSRIIRECSSGDTEDRQAITMARNRRSIRELWSHRRTGLRLEIWGNRKHLLGWDRFLCFSRYSGCW